MHKIENLKWFSIPSSDPVGPVFIFQNHLMTITQLREAYGSNNLDFKTALGMAVDAQNLLCIDRSVWKPPSSSLYPKPVSHWLEELLYVSFRLIECYLHDPKQYLENDFLTKSVSFLLFSASQIEQFDVVLPAIDRIVQDLVCVDLLIPFFISAQHNLAVTLLLDTYGDKMSDCSLISACLFLSKFKNLNNRVPKYLERFENRSASEKYVEQIALIKIQMLILNKPLCKIEKILPRCFDIVDKALEKKENSFQLWYAKAYLYTLKRDLKNAFSCIDKTMKLKPYDSRIVLLALRILRANHQPKAALSVANNCQKQFQIENKWIKIEKLFAALESNQKNLVNTYITELLSQYSKDTSVFSNVTKLCLISGDYNKATRIIKNWAPYDNYSSDFYFYFSQLCLVQKEYDEAKKFINMAIDINPYNADYYGGLVNMHIFEGEIEEAKDTAKLGLEINPYSLHLWKAYLKCLSETEDSRELPLVHEKIAQLKSFGEISLDNVDLILFQNELLLK